MSFMNFSKVGVLRFITIKVFFISLFFGCKENIVSKNEQMAWIKIGLTLSVAILFLGSVSGGKFNPAVSFMFLVADKTPLRQFLVECLAQVIGALVALYLYKSVIR